MRRLVEWFERTDAWRPIVAILLVCLFWAMLAACVAAQMPAPYADVAPEPQPQALTCALSGVDGAAFTLACAEPTATATATPAHDPAKWQFLCSGDPRCVSGQFPLHWDRDRTMLRCAASQGEKVTRIADGYSLRLDEGEPLAWVVTGIAAGPDRVCEGWVPITFLQKVE